LVFASLALFNLFSLRPPITMKSSRGFEAGLAPAKSLSTLRAWTEPNKS